LEWIRLQKLYRFINCVELLSPHHAAKELMNSLRQGQITSLFQKSVKRVKVNRSIFTCGCLSFHAQTTHWSKTGDGPVGTEYFCSLESIFYSLDGCIYIFHIDLCVFCEHAHVAKKKKMLLPIRRKWDRTKRTIAIVPVHR